MMKRFRIILLVMLVAAGITSCELTENLENPNAITADQANLNFLVTRIELQFVNFYEGVSELGMENTRMLAQIAGSTYDNSYVASDFDGLYEDAYAEVLIDANTLVPLAQEEGFFTHVGIARFFTAYTYVTLVDFFGDVPFSEALDPNNFSPNVSDGADVYDEMFVLLDSAIADFQREAPGVGDADLIYGSDDASWIRACNTLKLKMFLNLRLVDPARATSGINGLLAEGNLILNPGEDFVFQFSTNSINPDSRHPKFVNSYSGGTDGGEYQSNYFLRLLLNDKGTLADPIPDPRLRYYFYRQSTTTPDDPTIVDCLQTDPPAWYRSFDPFCIPFPSPTNPILNGYWGRDHVDNDGIPPDNQLRTAWGLYPAGGLTDNDQGETGQPTFGAQGAGIWPFMTHFFTNFMLAEAAQTLSINAEPADVLLDRAITQSIEYVQSGANGLLAAGLVPITATDPPVTPVADYLDAIDDQFAANALRTISREFYIAAWGNGIEAYNIYRRTTFPDDVQPALLTADPGEFYRTFLYPAALVDRNTNVDQKPVTEQVFWDTNPPGILD